MKNKSFRALRICFTPSHSGPKSTQHRITVLSDKPANTLTKFSTLALSLILLLQGFVLVAPVSAQTSVGRQDKGSVAPPSAGAGKTYTPATRQVVAAAPINVAVLAAQEALAPTFDGPSEIRAIHPPHGRPERPGGAVAITPEIAALPRSKRLPQVPPPSATGVSPAPSKTFKGEFLSGSTIPPDTMGAVGTTHIVTVSNNMIRFQTRDGVQLSRVTLNSFWATATVKGVPVASAFDTKVFFDRFNSRFILVSSLNGPNINSGAGLAVTQTSDPTGTWNRFTVASDPTSTATAGHAIDYPSVGFNKNWIVVDENTFNYDALGFTNYFGQQIFVFDKQAAYSNTLSTVPLFEDPFTNCVAPFDQLGCGFTMAPAITEDNTTDTNYLIEDWDSTAAQLRLSKFTGTAAAPVLTVSTQFPQSLNSWRFNALRLTTSGGYMPQRDHVTHTTGTQRIMGNDSRIQNAVFRNGSLWTTHTVMLSTVPQPAGTDVGGAGNPANPDNHTGVQWWQIDPTIETGLSTLPLQRARIEDPVANNCHNGTGGTLAVAPCNGTATAQFGIFYSFPNISVNQNNDVLIGLSQLSNLTYASGGHAFRASTDAPNTTRDPVIFRPGQGNYNIGGGTPNTAARQNRWGDYSGAQTDPLNDTDFWTNQEYTGARLNFGLGIAAPWETWWALVKPNGPTPINSTSGLIISEFRLRGPQGVRDEFIELYNPSTSPIRVITSDNSDGWTVASNNGTTTIALGTIPFGTVIPARGHYLFANDQDAGAGGGPTAVYSLNGYPSVTGAPNTVRGADSDTGYSVDVSDVSGIALFNTSVPANFTNLTVVDAAGPTTLPGGSIFREGAGFATLPITDLQYTMHRTQLGGTPADTGNNATDFLFNDVASTVTTAGQRLGAPGPENLDGPILNTNIFVDRFNVNVASNAPNNIFRKLCGVAEECLPNRSALGTLSIRRKVTNFTGAPVTRIRFRVRDLTAIPSPVGTADIRPITSADAIDVASGLLLRGTTLEEPATQALGGGLNSSWGLGIVNLATPLAPGASVDVQFLLGVQQGGAYRVFVITEALP